MSEDAASEAEAEPEPDEDEVWARDTAPQTPYNSRQVGIGLLVLVIGAAVAFGVPLVLT